VYLVTTSRHATPPVRRLAREIAWSLGLAVRVNRGRMNFEEVVELARSRNAERVIIVWRGLHGNPGAVLIVDVTEEARFVLVLVLRGVVFAGLKARPPLPEVKPPVVSLGAEDELAEELALALNTVYLGAHTVEDLRGFSTYRRVVALEPVKRRDFVAVVKFLDQGEELGPKLLVRHVKKGGAGLVQRMHRG